MSSIQSTAMASIRNFPESYFSRVVGAYPFGLLRRNAKLPNALLNRRALDKV